MILEKHPNQISWLLACDTPEIVIISEHKEERWMRFHLWQIPNSSLDIVSIRE